MLAELFAVRAPVFFGASLGFFWIRLGYDYPVEFVTKLVFNIGTPALILAALGNAEIDARGFGQTMLGTLLVLATMAAGSVLVAKLLRKPWQVIISPMMYPNTSNMPAGGALCLRQCRFRLCHYGKRVMQYDAWPGNSFAKHHNESRLRNGSGAERMADHDKSRLAY